MKKIVLKVLALFFISFTVVLAGCGSSPGDKFLGTWNKGDDQFETYLVIEKIKIRIRIYLHSIIYQICHIEIGI